MDILWLSHLVPYPPKGGAPQRSYHLLRETARRHSVHLVAFNQRALLPTEAALEHAVRELSRLCASVSVLPIPADASPTRRMLTAGASVGRALPYELLWLESGRMEAELRRLAAERSYAVVHVDTIGMMPYRAAFAGTPTVLNHHNVESHMAADRATGEWGVARLFFRQESRKIARVERALCPAATVNVTVSALDSDRLRRQVPGLAIVEVENGVDVDYFRPGVSGRAERGGLVFAGSLNLHANREAVLFLVREVWPLLAADRRPRTLTVIGRDPPPELVAAAQRDPRIRVTGWVDDVRPFLDEAAIYVCPLRHGGGTRLKVLDALAMGKPLVASAFAVEGQDLVDGRHYLRAETGREFASQILRLEGDAQRRKALAAAGRDVMERRFAWSVIGQKLEQAYGMAVGRLEAVA